jgi:hypothetical protein
MVSRKADGRLAILMAMIVVFMHVAAYVWNYYQ